MNTSIPKSKDIKYIKSGIFDTNLYYQEDNTVNIKKDIKEKNKVILKSNNNLKS